MWYNDTVETKSLNIITVAEAAKILGIDRTHLYRLIRQGKIEVVHKTPILLDLDKVESYKQQRITRNA